MPVSETAEASPQKSSLPGIGLQIALIGILVAGALGFAAGSITDSKEAESDAQSSDVEEVSSAILVDTWTVQAKQRWDLLKEPATVYAVSRVQVASELEGLVLTNKYQQGETISGSGVLLSLDQTRKELMLTSALAKVQLLDKRLELLQKQMNRMTKLQKSVAISEDAFDRSQNSLDTTKIEKQLAITQVAMARTDLESMVVKAPLGFTVLNRMVEPGERVNPGQAVAELADLRRVKIACQIGADSLRFVHELKDAQNDPKSKNKPNIQFMIRGLYKAGIPHYLNARIARISPAADPRTRRFLVELETNNPGELLRDGLPAKVIFRRLSTVKEIVIPRESVAKAHGLPVVYEIIDGKAQARRIEILSEHSQGLLAIKGLKEGVLLVKGGSSLVNDGSKVKILETHK